MKNPFENLLNLDEEIKKAIISRNETMRCLLAEILRQVNIEQKRPIDSLPFFHEDPYYATKETEILKGFPSIICEVILYGKCFKRDSDTPGKKIASRTEVHIYVKTDDQYWIEAMKTEEYSPPEKVHGKNIPEIDKTNDLILLSNVFANMKKFIWKKQKELVS